MVPRRSPHRPADPTLAAARPPRTRARPGATRHLALALLALAATLPSLAAQSVAVLRANAVTGGHGEPRGNSGHGARPAGQSTARQHQPDSDDQPTLALHLERVAASGTVIAPWPAAAVDWLLIRAGGQQFNSHQPPADQDDGSLCTLESPVPGMQLIAVDLSPRIEQVPAATLREFLATRVGEGTLPPGWRERLPEGTVSVRRIESSKVLLRVGDGEPPGAGSATIQGKTGQQLEIRLQADPTLVPEIHDLPLKVYLPSVTAGATRVLASQRESGASQSFATDGGGRAAFTLSRPGTWIFEVHSARPLPHGEAADWEISSATLSFEVPLPDAAPAAAQREHGR